MLRIDKKFLDDAGLGNMPEDRKAMLIQNAQEELERRVGEKMSEGLTIEQLREFDGIMSHDQTVMGNMLSQLGDYKQDTIFQKILEKHNVSEGDINIVGEYLSVKWVQKNRPDYAEITLNVAKQLQQEIIASKEQLV
ncbi:MAG: DUF5663 domain-containing protein [Candidatus Saccharibacteria bacterium]|nr:DUF5663 domain-containing protein [Candidatus Saccharibacteria bacterium]